MPFKTKEYLTADSTPTTAIERHGLEDNPSDPSHPYFHDFEENIQNFTKLSRTFSYPYI